MGMFGLGTPNNPFQQQQTPWGGGQGIGQQQQFGQQPPFGQQQQQPFGQTTPFATQQLYGQGAQGQGLGGGQLQQVLPQIVQLLQAVPQQVQQVQQLQQILLQQLQQVQQIVQTIPPQLQQLQQLIQYIPQQIQQLQQQNTQQQPFGLGGATPWGINPQLGITPQGISPLGIPGINPQAFGAQHVM
jgi:hypothetical protein